MSREVQVRFCESRAVRSRPATHLVVLVHGTEMTPRRSGKTSHGSWRRWAYACPRPRPGSATSTRASTSWASASSGGVKRHDQACGLYLPVEEGPRGHRRSGPHAHPTDSSSVARRPAAPAQSGAAGLVHLLQTRRLEGDLRLSRRVRVASSAPVDPPPIPEDEVGHPVSPVLRELATHRG